MKYNNFEVFPVGNAKLSVENDILKVSNIADSGLDGVVINTIGVEKNTVNFGQIPQLAEKKDAILIGYTLSYLPQNFKVFGKLNNKIVYEIKGSDLKFPSGSVKGFWIIAGVVAAAVAVGVAIWSELRTKKTVTTVTHYNQDGKVTGYSYSESEDPQPFEVEVNGIKYMVDEVGVNYDIIYPENLIDSPSILYHSAAEQITANNISSFEITSITRN